MQRRQFLQSISAFLSAQVLPFPLNENHLDQKNIPKNICDIHIHLLGLSPKHGCYINPKMENSFIYKLQKFFLDIDSNTTLEEQDRQYVDWLFSTIESSPYHTRGILLALDGVYGTNGELDKSQTPILIPNDYLFKICKKSKKLYAGASIHPLRGDALDELDRVAELGAVLIKWIPNSQGIDPSDERWIPFYQKMVALNLPLLCHSGMEYSIPSSYQNYGNPTLVQLPLEVGVKVIVAHCAVDGRDENGFFFFHFLEMLENYPNLMGDISALSLLHKIHRLRYLLNHPSYFERLYYGSDFPLQFFPASSPYYFLGRLTLEEAIDIQSIDNVLVRNVTTLFQVGVPKECLERGLELIDRS